VILLCFNTESGIADAADDVPTPETLHETDAEHLQSTTVKDVNEYVRLFLLTVKSLAPKLIRYV